MCSAPLPVTPPSSWPPRGGRGRDPGRADADGGPGPDRRAVHRRCPALSEGQLHAGRRNGLLVQVKQNQPTLHETLARLCATPSTATGGVARSIDWSSTPAGPRVAAADHLRRPGFAPDLREGHPVCGRRVRRSAATPVRSVSTPTPAPSALTGALRTGTITFGMWARTTAGSGKSPARWPASVPLRSISYAPMASRTSAKLSISTPSTSYQRPQLRQATRARILMTRTEWPCHEP